ncbi:MAG TPA: hypothetical protein PKK43_00740, partial [Spirochaetota bacterium]|nr:hypothetical protein [Spirochaetota bacterium]
MLKSGSIVLKLLLSLTVPAILIQCASAPKMATVEKDGESVDIVFTSSYITSRQVRHVRLAPDKSNVMVTFSDGDEVVIDPLNGIDPSPSNKEILEKKKDPWCSISIGPNGFGIEDHNPITFFNKMTESQDHIYSFHMDSSGLLKVKKQDKVTTDGFIPFGHNDTRDVSGVTVYFFANNKIAVLSGWDNQVLEIYDIKTNKVLCSAQIPSTDKTNFRQYSMSADEKGEKLFVHSCYFIQLFDMKTAKHLANLIFTDKKNWVLVTDSGKYDGTTDAVNQLAWKVGKEEIPLINFGPSFYVKGLLGSLLGYSPAEVAEKETPVDAQNNQLDMKKQLIGKVHKVGPNDVIISIGLSKKSLAIGEKLFVLIDGKKTVLEVTYPMMASAKCKIKQGNKNVTEGLPVFV